MKPIAALVVAALAACSSPLAPKSVPEPVATITSADKLQTLLECVSNASRLYLPGNTVRHAVEVQRCMVDYHSM